jgi:phosphosulfolactate phosphohydrolase-like enzyme
MKLNFKKMKLNQVILIVAILVIVAWNILKSRRREKLEDVATASDIVLYVENREEPNPFIVHAMAMKVTDDQVKLEKILTLASEKKNVELLELVKTL